MGGAEWQGQGGEVRQEPECLVEHATLRLDLTRRQRLVGELTPTAESQDSLSEPETRDRAPNGEALGMD